MRRLICLIVLPFLLLACTPDQAEGTADGAPFYDLRGFISAETERLTTSKTRVEKTINLNGKTETKQIENINFENDLRLFREADINKPAWFDKYETKEQVLSVGHSLTSYLAKDSTLIVRRLTVEQDQGATTKIEIERHTGTVLSDGWHLLTYEPVSGYTVKTNQKNKFGEDVTAEISIRW